VKVDLTLLVPSWVLQYDTWREFLEVLEQSVNEIASNVDDLRELYDVEKAKEFIVLLARNFGFKELVYQDIEKNVQLLDNQLGFVQWKGSEEFFKWLLQLFEMTVVFKDLSKDVLMWSGGGGWDRSVIEDGKYYRDGSVEVTVPVAQFWKMKEIERFVCAGVYVWYMVITGLQMLSMRSRVSAAEVDVGLNWEEVVRMRVSCGMEEDKGWLFEGKGCLYAVEEVSSWGISNEKMVIDVGLGGVGIARGESIGSMLKMMVEDSFSQKESVKSLFFAKSDNRYMIANRDVVILS
jgi:hypothetical protein